MVRRFSRSWACCRMSRGPGARLAWECLGPVLAPMFPGSAIMIAGILETKKKYKMVNISAKNIIKAIFESETTKSETAHKPLRAYDKWANL